MKSVDRTKHFFFRAGFGTGPSEIRFMRSMSHDEILHKYIGNKTNGSTAQSFSKGKYAKAPITSESMSSQNYDIETRAVDTVRHQWIHQMASTYDNLLHEKMTLFWHDHFACQCPLASLADQYLQAIRKHALGNYRDLLKEVSKTPAMLLFLNNQQNRKDRPNENFARELMELFTLGVGNYSETDIKEAARAFTGWSADDQLRFIFRSQSHDFGEKHFLGQRGKFDGDEIIDIILEQREASLFIAERLYAFFVSRDPNVKAINHLASLLIDHDYEILPVLEGLFGSNFFYDDKVLGCRIKSPIELIVNVMRLLDLSFEHAESLSYLQTALGQQLFNPPNVAGWPGGKSWINNATMMIRLNFAGYLKRGERFDHVTTAPLESMQTNRSIQKIDVTYNIEPVLELYGGIPYENLEGEMKSTILALEAPDLQFTRREMKKYDFSENLLMRILSLPEFQLS